MGTLDETNVGILCYISELPGFRGVLKQRYSDFVVNEVDCDGNVVHLTSFDPPPEIEKKLPEVVGSKMNTSYTDEIESFRSIAGDADAESLKAFIDCILSGSGSDVAPIVLSPDPDKSHRTNVHNFFKSKFNFLVTDTVDGSDATSKSIRVRFCSDGKVEKSRISRKRKDRTNCMGSKNHQPFDSRGSKDWPEGVGKFLRFHLYKENKDTQEALGLIGKMLGCQQRSFGFAGTKDKRSISTQRVTVFKQHAKRLASLNDRLFGIKVGNFCYVQEGLLLGHLMGNRFTITLRAVLADSEDIIKAAAESLGRNGFINYYGLQRFGSGTVPTHLIGAALLRGEWKTAMGLILDPREGERESITEARKYLKETDDIDGTLRRLPHHLVAERAILQCLKKCPGNYLQALKAVPRTLRMMYVHSYQSYLWNHAATLRVQKYGSRQVVLGDLVYNKGRSHEKPVEVVSAGAENVNSNNLIDFSDTSDMPETELVEEEVLSVKAVDDEDLLTGKYTIEDVVLPLPGSRILYPTNDIAATYHDIAKKDAVSLTESVHGAKEFSMASITGSYRRVFQKPVDFEWKVLKYSDPNIPLSETDMDAITKSKQINIIKESFADKSKGSTLLDGFVEMENFRSEGQGLDEAYGAKSEFDERLPQAKSVGSPEAQLPLMALKLSFTLPASCYATMAIRELLKTSTSVAFHKMLSQ